MKLAERHIADGNIKKVIREGGFLIALHRNTAFLIKLAGDAAGEIVHLHAIQLAAAHAFRQHTKKITNAAGRFQNVALREAHLPQGGIDAADDHRRRKERRQRRFAGGGVFGVRQQVFQFTVPGVFFIKKVRQTAPAHILCQHSLFLRCGGAVLRFYGLQGTDRVQIALKTLQRCALSDMVIGDAVVAAVRVQRIGKRVLLFLFRRGKRRRRLVRLRLRRGQRSWVRLLHNFPNKGDRFRAEDGKADLLDKGDVLKVDNAVRGIHAIHKEGPAVDLKYRFTGNKILCRKFCVGDCWLRGRLDRLLCGGVFGALHIEPFRRFLFADRLSDLLQIILSLPLAGEGLTDALAVNINFVPNIVPDGVAVVRFDHAEPLIGGRLLCGKPCCILCDLLHKAAFLLRSIMPVIEQAELTVYIGIKLKMSFMDKFIVAVIFLHFTQPGIQCVHEPHCSGLILQFFFNQRYRLIIIHAHVIGTRHIVRCIVQAGVNGPRHLSPLILRDLCDGVLTGESFLRDQALILLDHIGDGQMDGIIFLGMVVPFVVQPFVSLGVSIPRAAAAAVLTKAALDEFLAFLRRVGIAEVRIYGQSAIQMVTEEKTVDLVLCDEHFALTQKIRLGSKAALRVGQAVQHNADSVGVVSG